MPNTLCVAFSKVSVDTWHRIAEGRDLYWLGEETLTDLLMRDLLRLRPPGFNIQAFHKKQERSNGADWEWWFQGSCGYWIGMRVQAKVIHQDGYKFRELHRSYKDKENNITSYQSNNLILSAKDRYFPLVPIYCLYSHWLDSTYNKMLPAWVSHLDSQNFGCSIIMATTVRDLRIATLPGKAHKCGLKDTLGYSIPLAGLVCSPFAASGSIAERVRSVLELGSEYLLPSPPAYVAALMAGQDKQSLTGANTLDIEIDLPTGIVGLLGIQQAQ